MPWIRRKLRGNLVYARVDASGQPVAGPDGRVDVVYKLAQGAKLYRAGVRNLETTGDPADDEIVEADIDAADIAAAGAAPVPEDAVIIYTDGACTGNPGPMGVGAVILLDGERIELSEYLGVGTNNIAELTAILRALHRLPAPVRRRTVVVHSDSSYSIGLLSKNWKAKANQELVAELRSLLDGFRDVRFVKVKGHAGVPENERCDELARAAIDQRR